jgi:hypothetical protein
VTPLLHIVAAMSMKPVFSRPALPEVEAVGRRTGSPNEKGSESRSTSAGTHSNSAGDLTGLSGLPDFEYPSPFNLSKLPDIVYPSPFVIKNTFITAEATPSFGSLADFFEERRIRSCPVSGIADEQHHSRRVARAATTDCGASMTIMLAQGTDDAEASQYMDAREADNHDIFDTASTFAICEAPAHLDLPDCRSDVYACNEAIFDTASTLEDLDVCDSVFAFESPEREQDITAESPTYWPCHMDFSGCEEIDEHQIHHVLLHGVQHSVPASTESYAYANSFEYKAPANETYALDNQFCSNVQDQRMEYSMRSDLLTEGDRCSKKGEAEACIKAMLGLATQPHHMTKRVDDFAAMSRFESPAAQMLPPPPVRPPAFDASQRLAPPPPPPPQGPPPSAAPVLCLAEALPPAELCVDGLPSIGSQSHALGSCQPCAFFHTQGCQNGKSCQFCHLCSPGEKKKRLREKRVARREAKLGAFLFASGY